MELGQLEFETYIANLSGITEITNRNYKKENERKIKIKIKKKRRLVMDTRHSKIDSRQA